MARASGVTLEIRAESLPSLPGALALAEEFLPCAGRANSRSFTGFWAAPTVSPEWVFLCQDPQTSGGLLIAVRPDRVDELRKRLGQAGITAPVIGQVQRSGAAGDPIVRLV
jgi:selenide,water dikinase